MMSTFVSQTSDAVGRVLATIKVAGAVLSLAHLEAPFAVASGRPSTGVFHAVLTGEVWASTVEQGDARRLGPGQVAIFPAGDEHIIASGPQPQVSPVPVSASGDGPLPSMRVANGGPLSTVLCGTITFEDSPIIAIADSLPSMVVTGCDASSDWVRATVELIADELRADAPASTVVASRLADVLVVRALREMVTMGLGDGWAAGVREPEIAKALAAVHADPSAPWTVGELARLATMSRSSFYERFTETVGTPPGEYVTRWRIHVACGLLTSNPVSTVARRVGFKTDAGFSTAFKRLVGVPPSKYRPTPTPS
jgi:AraC-like DNA-binding protein